jgi:thiamine-monophosphate kinase
VPLPEKALIARIRKIASTSRGPRSLITGIGDDCAVLRPGPGHDFLITTDFSLEGIHFRRDWHTPEIAGRRCLARGLSDIAAMGGTPVAAFLSLAVPRDLEQSWIDRFVGGLIDLARKHGVRLAGGDTAEFPQAVLADIVVVGSVPHGRAVLRSGAKPGELIYVSGELGGSSAAIRSLHRERKGQKIHSRDYPRHFLPEPRVQLGRILREKGIASAMIDTSDGLSTDLAHICEESKVGAEIDASLIPRSRVGKPAHEVDLDLALHGGEDYELLFTAHPAKGVPGHLAGVTITQIGRITRSRKILVRNPKGVRTELHPRGWEHFDAS